MDLNRREFLETAGVFTTVAAIGTTIPVFGSSGKDELLKNPGEHKLPELPYAYDAFDKYIDAKTIELHHTKHHQAYVTGLNKAEAEINMALGKKDFTIIDYWLKKLAFHGAGHFLHTLYWNSMSPNGGKEPKSGALADRIKMDFGTLEKFKLMFSAAATSVEGSGWAMLVYQPSRKKLEILQIENHQKLTTWDIIPVMVIDVWEHAYYLKYQNKRADYVKEWWNVVNWENAEKNLALHPVGEKKK